MAVQIKFLPRTAERVEAEAPKPEQPCAVTAPPAGLAAALAGKWGQ